MKRILIIEDDETIAAIERDYLTVSGFESELAEDGLKGLKMGLNNRYDLDHNLENIVYNELIYRGFNLKVFNNNNKEIDFYATKDGKEYFIQVSYSIVNEKTYNREFEAFKNIDNLSQKIIITTDEIDYSTSCIRHISLKDFLKMESL